jgi:hypothetical protein
MRAGEGQVPVAGPGGIRACARSGRQPSIVKIRLKVGRDLDEEPAVRARAAPGQGLEVNTAEFIESSARIPIGIG